MTLSEDEARVYRQTLETVRRQLEEIDAAIERELAAVRERIASLQERRQNALKMYEAACAMLGIPNDLVAEEEESKTDPGF